MKPTPTLTSSLALIMCLSLTTISCSARNIRTPALSHELLFPLGTYKHRVRVNAAPTPEHLPQTFSFDGVIQISVDRISVVGLSPFGATLFKLVEQRSSGNIEIQSFIDAFKGQETKFREYYATLRLLLTAPHDFPESSTSMPNTTFKFKKYDKNGIPERIEIQHPKFSIDIKVTGYDI